MGWRSPGWLPLILTASVAWPIATWPDQGWAQACGRGTLSALLLDAARRSHLQVVFNPRLAAGRCAPGYAPSTRPEADLERLAASAGLQAVQIKPGLVAMAEADAGSAKPKDRPERRESAPGPSEPAQEPAPAATVERVIVTARLERGSLVQKRFSVAESSVISTQEIGSRPVSNVVDAASILPGVSAYADMGLGQAATGDPEFITVRGIDSSNNVYELNGMRAPQSDPYSRALSLKMLPPFGLQSIQIIKSPTADYDGDFIGGVVDMHTPSSFDFAKPLTRITLQGDLDQLAIKTGLHGEGGAIQFEVARTFLSDSLGVYATTYFQKTNSVGESGEVGDWRPTLSSQSALTNYRLASGGLSADEYKWDFYTNQINSYGGAVSIDYHAGGQSLYLRLTAAQYDDQGVDSQFSLRQQLVNTGTNTAGQVVDVFGNPVGPGLSGIAAYAPQQTSLNPGGGAYNAAGVYDPNGVMAGGYFQLRDQIDALYTLKAGGASSLDRWTLSYAAAYGFSRQARPNYVEGSSYGLPLQDARLQIDWLNDYTPRFLLTPAQQAYLFDQANTALWKLQGDDSASADSQYSAKIDADYRLGAGLIQAIHGGAEVSDAYRSQYLHDFTGQADGDFAILSPQGYAPPFFSPAGPSLNAQPGQNISGAFLNFPGLFRTIGRGPYVADILPSIYTNQFALNPATGLATIGNPGAYTINDYNAGAAHSTEIVTSGYVSADLQLGRLGMYPGLRYETTGLDAAYWDATVTGYDRLTRAYGEVLPSVNVVYRSDDGLVYRAAIRRGFSRPALGLMASPPLIGGDGVFGPGAVVTESNPNLKPTTSINYDASIEYYGRGGDLLELAVYRKTLSHIVYGAVTTNAPPQAPQDSMIVGGITYSQYVNGGSGYLNGLEVNAEKQFVSLPAPLDHLAMRANATFQHSEADSGLANHFGRLTWLPRAPELTYNLQAVYETRRLNAALTYQYTGLQLENLTGNDLDNFLQPTRVLDAKIDVLFRGVRWAAAAKNLTNGPVFWKTLGESKRYLGAQDSDGNGSYVMTGRVFTLAATKTW